MPARSGKRLSFFYLALAVFPFLCAHAAHADSISAADSDSVYVWQRKWNADVLDALKQTQSDFREFHYLAGQWDGHWSRASTDADTLRNLAAKSIPVFRLDGGQSLSAAASDGIVSYVGQHPTSHIELDYDCASSRLPDYDAFIGALRHRLPPGTRITITALADWLHSPVLTSLLRNADSSILQVHGVMAPNQPLFDPVRASAWIREWAARTVHPFQVALPAYGILLHWTPSGMAVEAEQSLAMGDADASSIADPAIISSWLRQQSTYPNFTGYVWFRLPTRRDHEAWSLPTLLAVMRQQYVPVKPAVTLRAVGADTYDVILHNSHDVDIMMPTTMKLWHCSAGDDSISYRQTAMRDGLQLTRRQPSLLQAGSTITVGWVQCKNDKHIEM